MDYNKIHNILDDSKLTLGEICEKIGLSRAGLYRALKNKTLKISTLELLAQTLDVPVFYFFTDEDIDLDSINNVQHYKDELQEKNETLSTIKEKLNAIYNLYFRFMLSLDENDTRTLYQNKKLQNFEVAFLTEIQEAFVMLAETHKERKKQEQLSKILKQRTSKTLEPLQPNLFSDHAEAISEILSWDKTENTGQMGLFGNESEPINEDKPKKKQT